jgi:exodeoxyribonuclease VII large subunit
MTARRPPRRGGGPDLDLFAESAVPEPAPRRKRAAPIEAAPPPMLPDDLMLHDYDEVGEQFPGASAGSAISVATLTETARDILEGAFIPLWVRGEVSDFKRQHRAGHWYFTLRDRGAQIRCAVWSKDQRWVVAAPDDGMQVAAFGRLSVYAARGEMRFVVTRLEAEGDGLYRKALEITRARLDADGLLHPDRKRPLPRFPRVIAVVTSPSGAAMHDIIAVLRRRSAAVRLVIVPAAVQGDSAPDELCAALDRVSRWGGADVVIVGRGGGAREDLWAFNDERVARAVAACSVPTISAVGHEIDISICDLVADHRAPTPSAAAEAAFPSRAEVEGAVRECGSRITGAMRAMLRSSANALRHGGRDLAGAGASQIGERRSSLESVAGRLHALSPLATLARGYAVARGLDGGTLGSVRQFAANMPFELLVRDGVIPAVVRETPIARSDA